MKKCNQCGIEKEYSEFYIDKRSSNPVSPCKKCKCNNGNIIIDGEKKCLKCKEKKNIIEFSKLSTSKDGYRSSCNNCMNIEISTEKKTCVICKKEKELHNFYKRPDSEDGYRNDCKECKKISLKEKIKKEHLDKGKKVCIICNVEKELKFFYKRKNSIDGYRNDCINCFSVKNKDYCLNNKEIIALVNKEYRENNKEKLLEYQRDYSKNNRNKINKRAKKYNDINREKIREYKRKSDAKRKEKRSEYRKNRLKTDPVFKFSTNIRRLISMSLKNGYVKKDSNTAKILGCDYHFLFNYFENQFENWMNWNNHGIYTGNYNETWQIDHIIPLNSVDKNLPEEEIKKLLYELNHYSNLRPLCSRKNLEKKW